jgi:hypothetical protein
VQQVVVFVKFAQSGFFFFPVWIIIGGFNDLPVLPVFFKLLQVLFAVVKAPGSCFFAVFKPPFRAYFLVLGIAVKPPAAMALARFIYLVSSENAGYGVDFAGFGFTIHRQKS